MGTVVPSHGNASSEADTAYAAEFVSNPTRWVNRHPGVTRLRAPQQRRANKEVAHIMYGRLARRRTRKGWSLRFTLHTIKHYRKFINQVSRRYIDRKTRQNYLDWIDDWYSRLPRLRGFRYP